METENVCSCSCTGGSGGSGGQLIREFCEAGILTSHICDRFGDLIKEEKSADEGKALALIENLEE